MLLLLKKTMMQILPAKRLLTAAVTVTISFSTILTGCTTLPSDTKAPVVNGSANHLQSALQVSGTNNDYARQAIYFLLTDRFVDGDSSNNHEQQGGEWPTFNRPLIGENGEQANVGYLGGDFQGVLNNGQYIHDMGFTSVWLTPIYDNPDQAFSGGEPITFGGQFKDGGKTGYHGYWGVNFYQVDEHYDSAQLRFKDFTQQLKNDFQLNFVLDIVANHGSPAYTMPIDQPKFGEIYDKAGKLIADHQNLHPEQLSTDLVTGNPLHKFYNNKADIGELSDNNENNPEVLNYFTGAYLQWLSQGADSIRIDTIKHMPHHFWKKLTDNIRAVYPNTFFFAESYSYDAQFIAEHTKAENGGVSVLDFPGQKAITQVFENKDSDYSELLSHLHLTDGVYHNPYELMTFYDNHDMARMNASDSGFIDANNWLFTSRGIPVIYYGSEINFMTGKKEHQGNRNYLGQSRIDKAPEHAIHKNLTRIANIRKNTVALQKGVQVNIDFKGDKASFYRIYQQGNVNQTVLVLLNKGDQGDEFAVNKYVNSGTWHDLINNESIEVSAEQSTLSLYVPAHGVRILVLNKAVTQPELVQVLSLL